MAQVPIEDNYVDILKKAQLGLGASWDRLALAAGLSRGEVESLLSDQYNDVVARRLACHLHLGPNALSDLALKGYSSFFPKFKDGFAAFNTPFEGMTVNSYLIWDRRSKQAAAFDTGGDASEMRDLLKALGLSLKYLFITHDHPDHVALVEDLHTKTGCDVWMHKGDQADAQFKSKALLGGEFFHIGELAIKIIHVGGHTPGAVAYYITGLGQSVAVVGDAIFAGSIGKITGDYLGNIALLRKKLLSTLPIDTVIAPGHGPMTTVATEKMKNPFFGR